MSHPLRRLTPEERPEEYEIPRHPNQPENDIGGAVGGAGVRLRDENALSFRHFLQPHSDLVPQPAPTRCRGVRGGVDLVEATMTLPDFVQDHLVLESSIEPSQDMSPSRPHSGHPLDLNVLNDILDSSSQRNSRRNSHNSSRRSGHDPPMANNHPDNITSISHTSALPDFLSDGAMQLSNDSPSPSSGGSRGNRSNNNRQPADNILSDIEPVRGPSFDSKESLRLQIERLRSEIVERNRRINQLETELTTHRSASSNLESSLRSSERNLSNAIKRANDAEKQLLAFQTHSAINGHGSGALSLSENGIGAIARLDSAMVLNIARTSESLIGQLLQNMQELKKFSEGGDEPESPNQDKSKNHTEKDKFRKK